MSTRGGKRPGSGRPAGTGKYGEATELLRVPQNLVPIFSAALDRYKDNLHAVHKDKGALRSFMLAAVSGQDNLPDAPILGADISGINGVINGNEAASCSVPLYESRVAAGFPSPATDYEEGRIDLNSFLIKNPSSTFLVRVQGESMIKAGIHPDDVLVVDRSVSASHGRIVIAVLDGELTVKRLWSQKGRVRLMPENDAFVPIEIREGQHFMLWGVVTNVIHAL